MTASQHSFDPGYYAPLFAIEDRHFWFRARNRIIATLAGQITTNLPPGYRVLEVGCGTGNVLRVLQKVCSDGVVVGMDLFAEGLQYARGRTDCPLVQGNIQKPPFGASFDLIGIFDVMEHLPDDEQLLSDLYKILTPGGTLLLTVPAHPSLWSYFDEAARHCRRYEPGELKRKLIRTGYRIDYITQYMSIIFPVVWLRRRLEALISRFRARDADLKHYMTRHELQIVPIINELLTLLLAPETLVIARRRQLPIGTSLIAIARKD